MGARFTAAAGFTAAGLTSPAGLVSAAEAAAMPGNLRGVSSQDVGPTSILASLETAQTTETQLEYWKRLTEWLQVNVQEVQVDGMMKDSVVINLKPEGAKALAQMDLNDPKNLTTMDFALLAALQRESTEGSLPPDPAAYTEHLAGTYDLLSISDDVARRYAVEPKAVGVVNTYFVEQEGGVFVLNVKGVNVLSTLERGDLKIAISQETLSDSKSPGPAENVPPAIPSTPDDCQRAFDEKRAAALAQAAETPPSAPAETPKPPLVEQFVSQLDEEGKKMLGGCLFLLGLGGVASLLGGAVAIALSGGRGGGGGNHLGQVRGNRPSRLPADLDIDKFLESLPGRTTDSMTGKKGQ